MARRIRAFLGPAHSQYTGAVAIMYVLVVSHSRSCSNLQYSSSVESGLVSTVSMAFIAGTFQCDTARWAAYYLGSQAIVSTLALFYQRPANQVSAARESRQH